MAKKSRKCAKRKAVVGTAIMFVISLAIMLLILLSPVSKIGTYKYSNKVELLGVTTETEVSSKFKLDGKVETYMMIKNNGKITADETGESEYKIENGKVMIKTGLIWIEAEGLTSTNWSAGDDVVQTNTLAVILKYTFITLTALTGVATIVLILTSKSKKK